LTNIYKQVTMVVWQESSVLFICFAISSSEKCLRVSKTESYGLSRIYRTVYYRAEPSRIWNKTQYCHFIGCGPKILEYAHDQSMSIKMHRILARKFKLSYFRYFQGVCSNFFKAQMFAKKRSFNTNIYFKKLSQLPMFLNWYLRTTQ
jgi:hypothetical protein